MAIAAPNFVNEAEIDLAVRNVENTFAPEVVRIRHSLGGEYMGFPLI
jgi:hypothetical protein